jgi:hypothetical protein
MNMLENVAQSIDVVSKSTRRQGKKSSAPKVEPKVKTAISLSPDSFRRLGIAAVMSGRSQSELVESWIAENCKRWVVSDRLHPNDRRTGAGELNPDGEIAA